MHKLLFVSEFERDVPGSLDTARVNVQKAASSPAPCPGTDARTPGVSGAQASSGRLRGRERGRRQGRTGSGRHRPPLLGYEGCTARDQSPQ
ncbi:hypothetical protein MTO96_033020 [Rhipicephalus appendiculatus]